MKRYLFFLVTLTVLIVGCFSPRSPSKPEDIKYTHFPISADVPIANVPVVIDTNFSQDDKLSIDNSIRIWNYVLNGFIVLNVENYEFDMEPKILKSVIDRDGLVILKVDSSSKLIPVPKTQIFGENKSITLAWADEIGGNKIWVIRDRISSEDVFHIMLHELGHVLGADHEAEVEKNVHLLMYPKYWRGQYYCVDASAMQKVAMFQNLRSSRLNYCYY